MYERIFKRIIDFLLALIILPVFLIFYIVIGLFIKLEDVGPIIYTQRRLGKNGKIFNIKKFRSMKINAPDIRNNDGSTFNSVDDPRLTKIGKFIRKLSIDEIPQIINVLMGDMSFIGPRPDLEDHFRLYTKNEKNKLNVLPGVTGYNQVYHRNSIEWKERIKNDLYYVNNISFVLDLKIFVKTIVVILLKRRIYSCEQVRKEEMKMNKLHYKFLEWDTNYFGINSGRVTLDETIGSKEWNIVSKVLKKNEFNVIDNVNNDSINNLYISKLSGAFVTDINFQFTKEIKVAIKHANKFDIAIQNKLRVNNEILEISKNSYKHSRFFNDPYLNKAKAKNVYGQWVQSAFLDENKYFINCYIDSKVAGYILFSLDCKTNTAIIELISVKEGMQNGFIGKEMMIYLEKYIYDNHKDIKDIRVGTQSNNINAINFYVRNGFRVKEIRSVYHYWPNKDMEFELMDEAEASLNR